MSTTLRQVRDLQRKIQLLEGDRSALEENSQKTITKNHEIILQLRQENKILSRRLANSLRGDDQDFREVFLSRSEKAAFKNMSAKAAFQVLDQQVCKKKKKLNALKHTTITQQQKLEGLKTQCERLRSERRNPKVEENSKHNLRMMENRLEDIKQKGQEAKDIKKRYLNLKQQLKEESMAFEPRLNRLKAGILRQKQEFIQLQEMNHRAHLARENAKFELQQLKEHVHQEEMKMEQILKQYKKQLEECRAQAEKEEQYQAQDEVVSDTDELLNREACLMAEEFKEYDRVYSTFEDRDVTYTEADASMEGNLLYCSISNALPDEEFKKMLGLLKQKYMEQSPLRSEPSTNM